MDARLAGIALAHVPAEACAALPVLPGSALRTGGHRRAGVSRQAVVALFAGAAPGRLTSGVAEREQRIRRRDVTGLSRRAIGHVGRAPPVASLAALIDRDTVGVPVALRLVAAVAAADAGGDAVEANEPAVAVVAVAGTRARLVHVQWNAGDRDATRSGPRIEATTTGRTVLCHEIAGSRVRSPACAGAAGARTAGARTVRARAAGARATGARAASARTCTAPAPDGSSRGPRAAASSTAAATVRASARLEAVAIRAAHLFSHAPRHRAGDHRTRGAALDDARRTGGRAAAVTDGPEHRHRERQAECTKATHGR